MRVCAALLVSALAASLLSTGHAQAHSLQTPLGPRCATTVAAFYYPWYGGPPRWRHWGSATGDRNFLHHPDAYVKDRRYPENKHRDISSADYPLLGAYDSHSKKVVDRQLEWVQDAGIDVLISSWWGPGGYEDKSLRLLLDRIDATGSRARVTIYFETGALASDAGPYAGLFDDPTDPNSRARILEKATSWLAYVIKTYGNRRGFALVRKGKHDVPVIFVFAAGLLDPREWRGVFEQVRKLTGVDAFYQGDVEAADLRAQGRVFDGLHIYDPVGLQAEASMSYLERMQSRYGTRRNPAGALTDPLTVGSVYKTWASEARAMGRSWAAPVIPGFDDRQVRNPGSWTSRDHGEERTYEYFWDEALASRPDWILITSFNEWHEGTEIEPSVEYGNEFIRRTTVRAAAVHHCVP